MKGNDKVIVLTQSYWQTQYQESPEVIGKEVRIDDEAYKIIGVAPRTFEAFDARMKFVAPLSWPAAAENPQGRYGVGIQLFGRLKPNVSASLVPMVVFPDPDTPIRMMIMSLFSQDCPSRDLTLSLPGLKGDETAQREPTGGRSETGALGAAS